MSGRGMEPAPAGAQAPPAPRREIIAAVFVTYHPDAELERRVEAIAPQVGGIVIVDNASDAAGLARVHAVAERISTVRVVRNEKNLGLATALNQGVARAREDRFDWVLLLDQDTTASEGLIDGLIAIRAAHPSPEELAVLGSNFADRQTGEPKFAFEASTDCPWVDVKSVISAGSLLAVQTFERIGLFRDDFFIDQIDHEYCLRARRLGYRNVISTAPLMRHGIGETTSHRLLGRRTGTSHHSAQRRYYMVRNLVVVAREYLRDEPAWVLQRLFALLKSVILLALFEDDRRAKLRYVSLGCAHGIRGRLGKLEE